MKKVILKECSKEQGWNRNTDLCMDVKTILRSDKVTKVGKNYLGQLTRNSDDGYTFIETDSTGVEKRNPRIYAGQYITITMKDDGSYRPNFRPMKVGADFSIERYAAGVANELLWAFDGLLVGGLEEESR